MSVDEIKADALKVTGLYYAKPVAILLLFVSLLTLAYVKGRRSVVTDQRRAAAVDTVRITEKARSVAAETVTVKLKAKARTDTLVRVVSDTQLVVAHDTVRVPSLVVERIRVDSAVIGALRFQIVQDSAVIRAKDKLLAIKPPRSHWGVGASVGYACGRNGCSPGLGVGLVWRF